MKVLIVAPYFWPHPGGVESYSLNIAKQLKSKGWEVVIATSSLDDNAHIETIQGMKVYRLGKGIVISNTPVGWRWRAQLKKIYTDEKPDIINGHVPVPYLADIAERCRGNIPFVLTYHNDLSKGQLPQKLITTLLNRTVIRRTIKRSNHIITTSEYYVDSSPILKPFKDKVSIVSPGVDTQLFNTLVNDSELIKKYHGKRVILFVGSLAKAQQHKGVDTLISAFARLRSNDSFSNAHLVIIGTGDGKEMYQSLVESLGVSDYVELTGFVDDKLLAKYYKRANVFAMPSRDRSEGFGMVYMEASATGTAVIGTDVGGIPYAIQDKKTGLVIPPDNPVALGKGLAKLLSEPGYAAKLGKAGAKRAAAEFGWPLLGIRTSDIFTAVSRPNVIQIAGYYPPSLGGMERVAEAISLNLAERGYNVEVFTSNVNQPDNPKSPEFPNLTIRRFQAVEFAHTTFAPGFIPALFRVPKFSVFHLHLSQAFYPEWTLLAAKLRRIPYVVHFHLDLQPSGPLGFLFVPYKAIVMRTVLKHANAIIVFSPEQQTLIQKKYDIERSRIIVLPNGVSDKYFSRRPIRKNSKMPTILYVGRISSQKRVHLLIQALAKMKVHGRLIIIGGGEERASVEAAIPPAIASRVIFTGQLAPEDTLPYFKDADVFVMASKVEGMPLAILEAMASGLPIVGADVPGIKEIVRGVGILVQYPSAVTFARELDVLLSDPTKLKELSRKSLESAKHYSWPSLVSRLEQLYREISA